MTDEELHERLLKMPKAWRYRWCGVGELGRDAACACMGCANGSGALEGVTLEQYIRWRECHPPQSARESKWLHGWMRYGDRAFFSSSICCAGCGRLALGEAEGWREPDWPFDEDDCPLCQAEREQRERPVDPLAARAAELAKARSEERIARYRKIIDFMRADRQRLRDLYERDTGRTLPSEE